MQLARCGFPSEKEDWPKTGLVGLALRQQQLPAVACPLPTGHHTEWEGGGRTKVGARQGLKTEEEASRLPGRGGEGTVTTLL